MNSILPAAEASNNCKHNHILSALPVPDRLRLKDASVDVDLLQGDVLFDAGQPVSRVYFPHTAVASLLILTKGGDTVDVATIGCEGLIGIGGVGSGATSATQQIIQVSGAAAMIEREPWLAAVSASASLQCLLAAYRDAFVAQIMQSVACNALHSAEERLARWLLMTGDRSASDDIALTQELVAQMLGVRRPTITLIAQAFQYSGLIVNRRGKIAIVDRPGLEEIACECYEVVKGSYARMFSSLS